VVAKDGRATLWRWQLSLAQPKQVSFEHKCRTWYRACIEYGNGRLLALTPKKRIDRDVPAPMVDAGTSASNQRL
jgi:hypothetical protein